MAKKEPAVSLIDSECAGRIFPQRDCEDVRYRREL